MTAFLLTMMLSGVPITAHGLVFATDTECAEVGKQLRADVAETKPERAAKLTFTCQTVVLSVSTINAAKAQ